MASVSEHNDVIHRIGTILNESQLTVPEMLWVLRVTALGIEQEALRGAEEVIFREGDERTDNPDRA